MADPRRPEGQQLDAPAPPPDDGSVVVPRWGLGDAAGGWLASYLFGSLFMGLLLGLTGWADDPDGAPLWVLAIGNIPLWAGFIGIPIWAAATKGNGWVRDFGARVEWPDVPIGLALGAVMQVVLVPIVAWPVLQLTGKTTDDLSARATEMADKATGVGGPLLFLLIVGVMAPLAEELFFRGLVLRSFERRIGTWWALGATSLWFAVTHPAPIEFFPLFVVGAIFGLLAIRTGRLGRSVFAHIGFNVTSVVMLLWLS